jgi:hypothetical protein
MYEELLMEKRNVRMSLPPVLVGACGKGMSQPWETANVPVPV